MNASAEPVEPARPGGEYVDSVLNALRAARPGWYDACWVRLESDVGQPTVAPLSPAQAVADVLEVLVRLSLLDGAASGPSRGDLTETADWLASMSGHPRYGGEDGGAMVLASEADLSVAYTAAMRRHGPSQADGLGAARSLLLAHVGKPQ